MPTPLRIAVIGPGKVAHLHAKAVLQTPDTQLVAVYGRTFQKAEDFANRYGIRAYSDVQEMVDRENVDLCLVCTSHPAHREPTVAALNAGSHVLVEKPLASTLEDCDAMIEAATTQQPLPGRYQPATVLRTLHAHSGSD